MSLNDWVTRQAKGGGQDDKSNKRRRKKPKQFDDEKTMMYRLRFAGKYVEDKKNTFASEVDDLAISSPTNPNYSPSFIGLVK